MSSGMSLWGRHRAVMVEWAQGHQGVSCWCRYEAIMRWPGGVGMGSSWDTHCGGPGVFVGCPARWAWGHRGTLGKVGCGTMMGRAQAEPQPFLPPLSPCPCHHSVTHILNVAREIDNFFPALFTYMNVRVYDEETAQLLPHWNDTFLFLSRVRSVGPGQPRGMGTRAGHSGGDVGQGIWGGEGHWGAS